MPYALATGLGPLRSITIGTDGRLLVAGDDGAWLVDAQGRPERFAEGPVRAVTTHPDRTWLLRDGALELRGPAPATFAVGEVRDVLAVASGEVWLLHAEGVDALDPRTGARRPVIEGLRDGRALALTTGGVPLVLGATTLSLVDGDRHVVLRGGLRDARAAGSDARETLVIEARGLLRVGDPPETRSTWVDTTTDLVPALGPLFPPGGWYLVNTEGRVELFRPDAPPEG